MIPSRNKIERIKSLLLTVLAIIVFTPELWGGKVVIHGKVTSSDGGKQIEFVTVRIEGTLLGTMTGLNGEYRIAVNTSAPDSPDSTATAKSSPEIVVVFSCIGYKEVHHKLIDPPADVTLNVTMIPSAGRLTEVEVTDFRRQTSPMTELGLNSSDIRAASSVSGNKIESLISTLPGVASNNEMSSQYSVRGGNGDENAIYINGVEFYRPQLSRNGEQEGMSVVNPMLTDKVRFSSGGFPARYSDRMSSVMDISYRRPTHFDARVELGLTDGGVALGSSKGRFSQLHGVRYRKNSSLLSTLDTKGEYDPLFIDYQTSMDLDIGRGWNLNLLGNIGVNNYKFRPSTRTTDFGTADSPNKFTVYFDGGEKDRFETFGGGITVGYSPMSDRQKDFDLKNGVWLTTSGYLTNELVARDISGEYWLNRGESDSQPGVGRYNDHARNRLKMSMINLSVKSRWSKGTTVYDGGISVSSQHVRENIKEYEARDSAGYTDIIYRRVAKNRLNTLRGYVFAEFTHTFDGYAGLLKLNGGLRVSWLDYNKEFLLSPRVSLAFIPKSAEQWTFRVATGIYYQQLIYKEFGSDVFMHSDHPSGDFVENGFSTKLKSPRSLQVIAGADYGFRMFGRPFRLTGEFYYKHLDRLIPYEIDNLQIIYSGANLSKGYVAGVDFRLFGQFVEGSDSWISVSLMKTDELLDGVHVPLPTDRRYNISLFFTDYFPRFPRLKINLRGVLSDGVPFTRRGSHRSDGYFRSSSYRRVDLGADYSLFSVKTDRRHQIIKSAWIGFEVFNLFDISNVANYYWVSDVDGVGYAIPNYLTRRQLNFKVSFEF